MAGVFTGLECITGPFGAPQWGFLEKANEEKVKDSAFNPAIILLDICPREAGPYRLAALLSRVRCGIYGYIKCGLSIQ